MFIINIITHGFILLIISIKLMLKTSWMEVPLAVEIYVVTLLLSLQTTYSSTKVIFFYLFIYLLETEFRSCCPGWSAMAQSLLTATSAT